VFSFRIFEALGQTKVYYIDIVFGGVCTPDNKVIWLYISVNYSFFMAFLDALE